MAKSKKNSTNTLKQNWIYDLENYPNLFVAVFKSVKTGEIKTFEFSNRKDETDKLISFLQEEVSGLVGYNNVNYDYPILHYIITEPFAVSLDGIYKTGQNIINSKKSKRYKHLIPQLDLFLIHHYDNKNRLTSLKWLEFTLRWHKLQDLPIKPGTYIKDEGDIDEIIEYCINDVEFTFKLYNQSLNEINFRRQISKKLNRNVMNYSDVKIGQLINQLTYSRLTNRTYYSYKYDRTNASTFYLKDLIPNSIEFKSDRMKLFLETLKEEKFTQDDKFEKVVEIGDLIIKMKKGGIHSVDTPVIVDCKKGWRLVEKDIAAMYPRTIISEEIYPAHLGPEWCRGIEMSYNHRVHNLKQKLRDLDPNSEDFKTINAEQSAYKLSMNGGRICPCTW